MSNQVTLIIGSKRYSSWSLRPWLAAKQAGFAVAEEVIELRQPDTKANILKWSPSGKVPCLIHDGLVVWDSLAICEYLAERVPSLWPSDPSARAVARSVSAEMHSGFQALRSQCSMDVCLDQPMTETGPELAAEVERIDTLWEACRTKYGDGGPFLFGAFTIADAMFAPVVSRFVTYHLPAGPDSQAYIRAVMDLPAMKQWIAEAGQG